MLINITDADENGKRKLVVTDGDTELFSQSIADTAAGHRLAKAGQRHGWDSDDLAEAVKAETEREKARVEGGKKAAECGKPAPAPKPKD